MKRDDLIFDIIEKEHQRQLKGIELIASENFVSDQVMQAMGSCLTNIVQQDTVDIVSFEIQFQ